MYTVHQVRLLFLDVRRDWQPRARGGVIPLAHRALPAENVKAADGARRRNRYRHVVLSHARAEGMVQRGVCKARRKDDFHVLEGRFFVADQLVCILVALLRFFLGGLKFEISKTTKSIVKATHSPGSLLRSCGCLLHFLLLCLLPLDLLLQYQKKIQTQ